MSWKARLADRMPADLAAEIDMFDSQIELSRQDKIDEKVFTETRLRRGVYGQRNDGTGTKSRPFPSNGLTKGPEFYAYWGDPREFTLGDMGVGECAGEVVSVGEFDLAAAEAQVFEAQLQLEGGHHTKADDLAYGAMLLAAKGLIKTEFIDISDDPDEIAGEFRTRFFDTQLFFDTYAGRKFAMYLFRRHDATDRPGTTEAARQLIEKTQLFLEASHACQARLVARQSSQTPAQATVPAR